MGGPIAQLMWRRQPGRVDGLVLAATSRDFRGRVRDRLLFGLLPPLLAAPGYRLQAAAELGRFTSRGWIHAVDVPTSVIVAMDDQLAPVRRQLKLARSIDDAVAAFVDGDHYVPGRADADFVPVLIHECRAVARRAAAHEVPTPAYWQLDTAASG